MKRYFIVVLIIYNALSLKNKIMCGYQGWFTTNNDGGNNGWTHYKMKSSANFSATNCVFDFWPDTTDFSKVYPVPEFENKYSLPSARDYSTVKTHFDWMKQNDIDGIFLQRFGSDIKSPGSNIYKFKNQVFQNVMEAADATGRQWALMYDLSGLKESEIQSVIMKDWQYLNNRYSGFRQSSSYSKHNGQPVIVVWGIGFSDHRNYTLKECQSLISFLKEGQFGNNTIMIGVPKNWRIGGGDAVSGADLALLHQIALSSDIISPWTVGRYSDLNGAQNYARVVMKQDLDWCNMNKKELMPVIFPGFSWHNLQKSGENPDHPGPYNQIPRKQNDQYFLEKQGMENIKNGATMLYVAMFDQINEGTAIFKCSKSPPILKDGLRFVPYEESEDFYLKLTGKIGRSLKALER